jgi:transcriptional regulator with XRE-family HTH domain
MARALRDKGLKYKEIAEIMGVSHQCVAHMCGKYNPSHFRMFSDAVVYPNLRKWLNENKVSVMELIRRCGYVPHTEEHNRFTSWMYGKNDPSKRTIDACLKVTGMKYEELFYRE